jgi:hypothetical protein
MFVNVFSLFVRFCLEVAALRRAYPPYKESYQLYTGSRNWKSFQHPKMGCRDINNNNNNNNNEVV